MFEPDETTVQLNRLARAIDGRGMNAPAVLILTAVRPFRFVMSQLLVIMAPLIGWNTELGTSRLSWLLEDTAQLDHLISLLEEPIRITREVEND